MDDFTLDHKFLSGIDLLRRTGMSNFRIGFTDEEDGPPVIWHATAAYVLRLETTKYEVAAALDPVEAVMRLCEKIVDGGLCTHCNQNTIFYYEEPVNPGIFLEKLGCVYAWDPELKIFRRGCE
jgi:hypothetical protein